MGLRLIFIEGDDAKFVMDEWFNRKIANLPDELADNIMSVILRNIDDLPTKEGYSQEICGVVKSETPNFFKLEFLHEDGYTPILLDIEEIGLEEYLDAINQKKYLKNEGRKIIKSERTQEGS
jgi:hypothetical protein